MLLINYKVELYLVLQIILTFFSLISPCKCALISFLVFLGMMILHVTLVLVHFVL